jgi:pyruvate dehydrogenase E1 component alpha subunit
MAEANTAARGEAGIAPRAEPVADTKQALLDLYRRMLLLRRFEEAAGRVYTEGKIGGFCHLYIGQEAIGVGVFAALDARRDYLINAYRDHGHALAWGTEPEKVMAELYGKANGVARGKGGSMHMFDAPRHNLGGYGIVGGQIPLAVGVGFALRYQKKDGVVVCLFGEAAVNNGAFWESMNMAAIWKLPVIFICENNRYGMGTAIERSSAVTDVWRRACAHDLRGELVDGMDVLAVRDAVARAAAEARGEGGKPVLLEARTYRYRGHSMADPATYRTREELDREKKRDPLGALLAHAHDRKIEVTQAELEQLEGEVGKAVEAALRAAEEGPPPELASIWQDVYASADDAALHREI